MAKYKKQSKKSPLKKYGRRNVRKLDVSEQKNTYASNAKAQARVGDAISAIGNKVGDAYDTFAGKKKKKQKTDPKKAETINTPGLGGGPYQGFGGGQREVKLPSISEVPPLIGKGKSEPAKAVETKNAAPVGDIKDNIFLGGKDYSSGIGGVQGPATQRESEAESSLMGPGFHDGPAARYDVVERAEQIANPPQEELSWWEKAAKAIATPIRRSPGIQKEYKKRTHRKNPYGKSPMKRLSPLKKEEGFTPAAEGLSGGSHIPQMERANSGSYQGQFAAAADAGYNEAIDRHNYKQRVWAEKAKDLDDAYGKLIVEPTGQSAWDAQATNLATEWKNEFTELYNNKDDYSPEEFTNKLADIKGRAGQFQQASNNLQKIVADYDENLDNISASTPPQTIDVLETLRKNTGTLAPINVNGVPTLQGVTIGGQEVSVPISEIANGKNLWRYNTKVDIQPQLDGVTQDLSKFRTEVASAGGIDQRSIGWDQLSSRAMDKIEHITQNPKATQAIAAEQYSIDGDDWNMIKRDGYFLNDENVVVEVPGRDPEEYVRAQLLSEVQKQFQPYEQLVSGTKADPRATAARQQQQLDQAQQRIDNAQNKPKVDEAITSALAPDNAAGFTELNGRLNSKNYKIYRDPNNPSNIALVKNYNKKGKEETVATGDQAAAAISQILGGKITDSPTNRSPFRRIMDFFNSPFKQKKSGKLSRSEQKEYDRLREKYKDDPRVQKRNSYQNRLSTQGYNNKKKKDDYFYKTDLSDWELSQIEKKEHGRPSGLYDTFVDASERDRYDNAKTDQKIRRGDTEWLAEEAYSTYDPSILEYVTGKLNPVDNALGWAGEKFGYPNNRFQKKVARDEANYEVRQKRMEDLEKYYANLSSYGKDRWNEVQEDLWAEDEARSEPPLW